MKNVTIPYFQHVIVSGIIALIGIWVTFISYTQQPSEAFLFPRLISSIFAALAIWTFIKALLKKTKIGNGMSYNNFLKLLPGLIVMITFIFFAAKAVGFYTSSSCAVFIIISFYDRRSHYELKSWLKRGLITLGYFFILYGLFAILLKVYTPNELFF